MKVSTVMPSSARLFEAAFHTASIGMALLDLDGRWIRVNQALCQIVGYSETELLSKRFQDITHPEDLAEDLAVVRRLLGGEISQCELEKRYIHKEGRTVWIQLSVSLGHDAAGKPEVFVAQVQDITRRKMAEVTATETLAEKERLLAELQAAHETLRDLRKSLLTVCPWTKRIHHDGRWMAVDEFLSSHLRLRISHGISDEALAGVIAEMEAVERQRQAG